MNKFFIAVTIIAFLNSCNVDKKYKYIETVQDVGVLSSGTEQKDAEIINASSDSAAYMQAYQKFCIAKKVNKDILQTLGATSSTPLSFQLLDDKGNDITYKIFFTNKDSLEKATENEVFSMSNSIKESVDKNNATQANTTQKDTVQIKNLKPFFNIKTDQFEVNKKSWYEPKNSPKYRNQNGIYCYFGSENGNVNNFRFVIQYYADDWLFIQKYQFSIDGKAYELYPDKVETDSGDGGYIWEWCDQEINSSNNDLIEALANAKDAKIKFVGRQYASVKTISQQQIKTIKKALDLYKAMGGTF
jgi:hypothetical protein